MSTVENSGDPGGFGEDGGVAEGVAKPEEKSGEAAGHDVGGRHDNETHKEGEQDAT